MTEVRAAGPRLAVIGDVGGHLDALRAELRRLGVDPASGALPPDLTVVQVGDLVHRGPDSEGVVALVDRYLREQPGQWVQLVGNHEALYLHEPAFRWPVRVETATAAMVRAWWEEGLMHAAAAVATDRGPFLVTHAGLTGGFWRSVLGVPLAAAPAARALNALAGQRESTLFRTGAMLGRRASAAAGPVWADAATELVPSWFQTRLPFGQIHGHSSITDWSTGALRGTAHVAACTSPDPGRRHEVTSLPGGDLVGIDPGHGSGAVAQWRAWEATLLGPVST